MLLQSDSYRSYLTDELARRMRANAQYSQRAFARQLGMSPGELSEILRGKRKLSFNSVLRISSALGLNPDETRHLGFLVQVEKSRELGTEELLKPSDLETTRNRLSIDMFNIVSDWYCFGIINLAETDGFRWNLNWIAKRLGISLPQVRVAVERLERIGLLERKNGRLCMAEDFVFSPDGIPSEAVRNYHRQILTKAMDSLETQTLDMREIRGMTIAVDPEQIPAMKKDLSEFVEKFARKYSKQKNKKEVYQLEMAFIKLTQGDSDDVEKK